MSQKARIAREVLADLVFIASVGSMAYGAWLWFAPAGFLVAGAGGIYFALALTPTNRPAGRVGG